jgi:hypothetical protein
MANQPPDPQHTGWINSALTFISGVLAMAVPFVLKWRGSRVKERRTEQELGIDMATKAFGNADAQIVRLWARCDSLEKENTKLRDDHDKQIKDLRNEYEAVVFKLQKELYDANYKIIGLELKVQVLSPTIPPKPDNHS